MVRQLEARRACRLDQGSSASRLEQLQEEGRRARRGDLAASSAAGGTVKGRGRTSILEGEGAAGAGPY